MTRNATQVIVYQEPLPPQLLPAHSVQAQELHRDLRAPIRFGLLLILLFVVGFGYWAFTVPLAGGAVAQGVISPDGSRRTVQHLEGGIIEKLNVRDGDFISEGQPLLVLARIQPRAAYDQLMTQQHNLKITLMRLEAESSGKTELTFPVGIKANGTEAQALMASQERLFRVRRLAHTSKKRVIGQRIQQLNEQIRGFQSQVNGAVRQAELVQEEIAGKAVLAKKGYLPKPELLRMLRMQAEIESRHGQHLASISQTRQQIGEAKLQLIALDAERSSEIATQSEQIRAELSLVEEKLHASEDILKRTVIRAPVSGTIVDLLYKTRSGVVQPGAPILDIVPANDNLIIDARVSPLDIDVVREGLPAQIQLSAYSGRSTPRVDGLVTSISADRIIEEGKDPYYRARIEVDREALEKLQPSVELVPGMPADVIIVTGNRTLMSYLFAPILNALWKTFREA